MDELKKEEEKKEMPAKMQEEAPAPSAEQPKQEAPDMQKLVDECKAAIENLNSRVGAIEGAINKMAEEESAEGSPEATLAAKPAENPVEEKKESEMAMYAKHSKDISDALTQLGDRMVKSETLLAQFMNQGVKRTIPSGQKIDSIESDADSYVRRYI